MRKAIMKVLMNCLSRIMAKHVILKDQNFVGLPGGSTEIPISIIQMLFEDVKEAFMDSPLRLIKGLQ